MSDPTSKEKDKKWYQKGFGKVLGWIIPIVAVLLLASPFQYPWEKSTTSSVPISKENFVSQCSAEALKNNARITEERALSYCTCGYEKGVEKYGQKDWDQKMTDNDPSEAEIKDVFTSCLSV